MWRMMDSERALEGDERVLITAAVTHMRDLIESGVEDLGTGVDIFERMTSNEKLFALAYVFASLMDDTEPPDEVAWTEATVYAIFCFIGNEIQHELALSKTDLRVSTYRRMLARAVGLTKVKKKEWANLIESAADIVLLDRDFQNEDWFLDMEPDLAKMHKKNLGIPRDYFVASVPYTTDQEAAKSSALISMIGKLGETKGNPK